MLFLQQPHMIEIRRCQLYRQKGGMEMVESEMDQKWQELQDRIENAFGYLLRTDIQRIEYKQQFAVPLLEMSSAYREYKSPEIK
jgi:hypothetical protein